MKYRENIPVLRKSLETIAEISSIDELKAHVSKQAGQQIDEVRFHYFGYDSKTGWENAYRVFAKIDGCFEVLGISDGCLDEHLKLGEKKIKVKVKGYEMQKIRLNELQGNKYIDAYLFTLDINGEEYQFIIDAWFQAWGLDYSPIVKEDEARKYEKSLMRVCADNGIHSGMFNSVQKESLIRIRIKEVLHRELTKIKNLSNLEYELKEMCDGYTSPRGVFLVDITDYHDACC